MAFEFEPSNPFDLAAKPSTPSEPAQQAPDVQEQQSQQTMPEQKSFGWTDWAKKSAMKNGEYYEHDNKVYYQRDGKTYLLTGDGMGDVELDDGQAGRQFAKSRSELTEEASPITRKLNPLDPILHPFDTYDNIKERRRYYQEFYPGEQYSDQRHATMSYWLTKEIGPGWTDLFGVGNELQGFVRWDIPHFGARMRGEEPWAFQLKDIEMNRRGIGSAVVDELYPEANGGPTLLIPPSENAQK